MAAASGSSTKNKFVGRFYGNGQGLSNVTAAAATVTNAIEKLNGTGGGSGTPSGGGGTS